VPSTSSTARTLASRTGRPADDARADEGTDADAVLAASRALLAVVATSLAPALDTVSPPQFRVLVLLWEAAEPTRVGALATALDVHASTFSRMADRLESRGLVSRSANPRSRREILVELTPAGRRLVGVVMRRRRAAVDTILRSASPADRRLILRGLQAFSTAAGEPSRGHLLRLGV
jgi:DNA-binding MarR family transcriptional regulator